MPDIVFVCGANGSGKSTFTRALSAGWNICCVDPDALVLSGLSPIAAAKAVQDMESLFLIDGVSFILESTLTSDSDFFLMQTARNAGFRIRLIYIRLKSADIAIARVRNRLGRTGREVSEGDIRRRYARSIENLPKAMTIADSTLIIDNSGTKFVILEEHNEEL